MIDGHKLIMSLNDWWYSSFGYEETEESKAIKKVIDEVEKYVEQAEQTEPNCSEIPNNCEDECDTCRYSYITCRFMDKGEPCNYEPKTEPQTDIGTSDTVYSDTAGYVPRVDMTDCSWK